MTKGTFVRLYWSPAKGAFQIMHNNKPSGLIKQCFIDRPKFKIDMTARRTFLKEGYSEPQAWIEGYLGTDTVAEDYDNWLNNIHVSYDPYKDITFVDNEGSSIMYSDAAYLSVFQNKPFIMALFLKKGETENERWKR